MVHESIGDSDIAAAMNELFVNIKVYGEERADLEGAYQKAHQLLARRSGCWPVTKFLDPRTRLAFFAGAYLPMRAQFRLALGRESIDVE